ncbi:MAG: hypothetical protein HOM11_14635 [Methylococcales bacterium]|jgi:hypothetical protein|nr:hypothetical protein [Methylococcales bacterium]MBT7444875.1 hypothetical protein [Methylococcales bacterium]
MDYKKKIKSQCEKGAFSATLKPAERKRLLVDISDSSPLSISSIGYLTKIFSNDGIKATIPNPLLLSAINEHVAHRGCMSAELVQQIKKLFPAVKATTEKITRPLADFLFDLNEQVANSEENHPSWGAFFARTVSRHLLEDSDSPNEIDDEEANWLIERILSDGQYDYVEQKLLPLLGRRAKKMPESLRFQIELLDGAA